MLPNMINVVRAYMQPITIGLVTKDIVDYKETEVIKTIKTRGVRQPVDPQKLQMMPEGQRSWRYENLHLEPNTKLKVDDVIIFRKNRYRVIECWDFSEYGYKEYMIAQTFEETK